MDFTEEEIALGESLYGLFAPLDLPSNWGGEVVDLHDLPHRIIIYKRPLEEDFPNRRQLMIETSSLSHYDLTRKFYLKHHYEQTGVLRDYYADGDDMVVFRKRLQN